MKRVEITVPAAHEDDVEAVVKEHAEDVTTTQVEKDDTAFVQFEVALQADEIDAMTEAVKDLTDLETGDLTIEVLEQTARIEKGKRREGGTAALSVQEMYDKAFEFASADQTTWALIALGAGIAVFGAAMENVMVVIGSMVITPMLGPFIAISFGIIIGDRRLIEDSLFYGTLSILMAVSTAFVIALIIPTKVNPLIGLIADPGYATVPLSLFVGSAAALTFTTEMRESLAGVAVAIALVPPAAVVGISLASLNLDLFFDVSLVLVTNIISLVMAAAITFKLLNIQPSTYYRQKVSEEELKKALAISIGALLIISVVLAFLSYMELRNTYDRTQVQQVIDDELGDRVLRQQITIDGNTVTVELAVVDPPYGERELEERLGQHIAREVNVKLIAVKGEVSP